MKPPKIKTEFAIVDVKLGRQALDKLVGDHKVKIPITLRGFLVGSWSGDDGVSMEFEIAVTDPKLGKPVKRDCTCIRCNAQREDGVVSKRTEPNARELELAREQIAESYKPQPEFDRGGFGR